MVDGEDALPLGLRHDVDPADLRVQQSREIAEDRVVRLHPAFDVLPGEEVAAVLEDEVEVPVPLERLDGQVELRGVALPDLEPPVRLRRGEPFDLGVLQHEQHLEEQVVVHPFRLQGLHQRVELDVLVVVQADHLALDLLDQGGEGLRVVDLDVQRQGVGQEPDQAGRVAPAAVGDSVPSRTWLLSVRRWCSTE
ncbi:hypothetical protein SMICM17S_08140 [Streptomyces microflavus]